MTRNVRTHGVLFSLLAFARTTPNPAHQRADGLDPTKQADQNQRKLVANMEARLNKVRIEYTCCVRESEPGNKSISTFDEKREGTYAKKTEQLDLPIVLLVPFRFSSKFGLDVIPPICPIRYPNQTSPLPLVVFSLHTATAPLNQLTQSDRHLHRDGYRSLTHAYKRPAPMLSFFRACLFSRRSTGTNETPSCLSGIARPSMATPDSSKRSTISERNARPRTKSMRATRPASIRFAGRLRASWRRRPPSTTTAKSLLRPERCGNGDARGLYNKMGYFWVTSQWSPYEL